METGGNDQEWKPGVDKEIQHILVDLLAANTLLLTAEQEMQLSMPAFESNLWIKSDPECT